MSNNRNDSNGGWYGVILLILVAIWFFNADDNDNKNKDNETRESFNISFDNTTSTPAPTNIPTLDTTLAPTQTPTETPVNVSDIKILEEYTYSDGFWYTYHFVVVKNISDKSVKISTSTLAYNKDGKLISQDKGKVNVVGPGCTTIYYEAFETTEEITKYDTEMEVSTKVYYSCGLKDLEYKQTNIEKGAIFQVTNNGKEPVDYLEGYALFFNKGKLVGWSSQYFTDEEHQIKSGKTIAEQFTCYEKFDDVKFYLEGRIS